VATIFDIAKKAGVSITTVSRALNGYSDVNEDTRKRVMRIAEELSYYPNAAARSLQGKKTNTIALAPWLRDHIESEPFFKAFIGTLAITCLNYDLSLLVKVANSPASTVEVYRELAGSGRVDGAVLVDVKPDDERIPLLQELGMPFVAFGRTADYAKLTYPFVDVDGTLGIQNIMAYLFRQGHRCIAYFSSPFDTTYSLYRYQGYQNALAHADLALDPFLVRTDLQEKAETKQALGELFALPQANQPTAIVTNNDHLALNVIASLKDLGKAVGREPDQIAVTGFDDLSFSAYLQPSLTTLRQPIELTCRVLLDLLVTILKNDEENTLAQQHQDLNWLGTHQVLLQPELIVRDSA
jgi:DNA-binding LacI/PurR family transcriptional regulator